MCSNAVLRALTSNVPFVEPDAATVSGGTNARLIEAVMHSAKRGVRQKVDHPRDARADRLESSSERAPIPALTVLAPRN